MSESNKKLHIAILEYLQRLAKQPGSLDADSLDVAISCLGEALGLDLYDKDTKQQFLSNQQLTLEDVFQSGLNGGSTTDSNDNNGPKSLKDISAEDIAKAEQLKNEGNGLLGAQPQDAHAKYTLAIALNPFNHIFWTNRAVSSFKLKKWADCVSDCKEAIKLKNTYSKAHYRLGLALMEQSKYGDALAALNNAKKVAQDNGETAMVSEIDTAIAKTKQKQNPSAGGANGAANPLGGLDFGALAGMLGGGAGGAGGLDLGAIMQNPMFANMMQGMMGNMGGMGGMGANTMGNDDDDDDDDDEEDGDEEDDGDDAANGGAGGLDLSGIDMQDPQIQEAMARIQANPMAAMEYLNNPEIMAKVGPYVQQMLGNMGGGNRR